MILIQIFLFFNAILFSIATITEIQNQIDQLSKSTQENILNILLSTPSSRNDLKNTDENWCCKTDPGVQATSYTRQTTYYVSAHGRHKCGYDSCGVFGWSHCTRWCDEYWSEAKHGVETYLVYTQNICPNDQVICCAQNIYVLGHCISYTEMYNNQQLLAELNELGIVIQGPSVG
ncbi:unnamed protein product [Rotaria sp. Silwood2]|nr:unnamed protein product [Rotaria sp. Silwood2]CAF2487018.1 unnamed protein product [Rotaria sp. Silwood2]CAF2718353.1 unnamed protein product [Rotaria sp. Silwood2]CAF2886369.1 unnamed protein product [Rotaria sp. Silwood2]CAF4018027.1 unnamed protein product [Rotaria sp. Silwood2]